MPQHIKAYIVLLFLGSIAFYIIKKFYNKVNNASNSLPIDKLFINWAIITSALFLSQNVWIFFIIVAIVCNSISKRVPIRIAWYFFLILIAPRAETSIIGFGGIESLLNISYASVLSLFLLYPCMGYIKGDRTRTIFPTLFTDKILILYFLYVAAHSYREFASVTLVLKECINLFLIVILPYYTLTRGLKTYTDHKRVFSAILVAGMIISMVNIFEFIKHWLLYSNLYDLLAVEKHGNSYFARAGHVRARGLFNNSITCGYILIFVLCAWSVINTTYKLNYKKIHFASLLLILAGLYTTSSRGPWLGALLFHLITITILNKSIFKAYKNLFLISIAMTMVLLLSGQLDRIIALLPFIGEAGVDTYRTKLIENSLIVIERNLLFGLSDREYLATTEMRELMQGEGIIDIVNTYIAILLSDGLLGLTLYLSFLLLPLIKIYRLLKKYTFEQEYVVIGRSLIAMVIAHLLVIGTVSSIGNIYNFTWLLIGLITSFSIVLKRNIPKRPLP